MLLLLPYRGTPPLLLPLLGPRPTAAQHPHAAAPSPSERSALPSEPSPDEDLDADFDDLDAAEPPPRPLPPPPAPAPLVTVKRDESDWAYHGPPMDAPAPRAAEIKLDPRTAFRQRSAPRPAPPRVSAVSVAPAAKSDMIILPQAPTFRVVEQGLKSLINYLRTTQILTATAQKIHPDGAVEIALRPDAFVHLVLLEGSAPSGPPCVAEASIWSTPKPRPVPFGPAREACLWLELIGVRADTLVEGFLPKLHSLLYLRPELHVVPHDPRRLHQPTPALAAEPIRRFDVEEK
jgi:hypothetical protein